VAWSCHGSSSGEHDGRRTTSAAEIVAAYEAYDDHPIDEPDECGSLEEFRRAAAAT
jgi:hypothetical protein